MDTKNLECSDLELKFIQHCIVYYGACALGDKKAALFGFHKANQYEAMIGVQPLIDLQKRIFIALGFDANEMDKDTQDGTVTYYNDKKDGTLEKVEQKPLDKNLM